MSRTINMLSKAHTVKGQGVLSAYEEQVSLVKENLNNKYTVTVNEMKFADIMHYHTINPGYFLSLPFVKVKSRTVGYVHFLPETLETSIHLPKFLKKPFYWYVLEFYKSMDFLVTVNPYFIEKLVEYGVKRDKITFIPNYVSSKRFYKKDKETKNQIRKKYDIEKDKFVVLCVGQLQTRKGIFDFVEVAKKLPDIQFVWAGGFAFKMISEGYKEIKKLLEDPPHNVKFIGTVPREEMIDIYNMADLMFLASFEELFPMTILESANCKLPILLRDIDLYKAILEGYFVKGTNVSEFVDEISKLKNDSSYYEEAVKKADKCAKYYSEENVAKMWRNYYNKIYRIDMKSERKLDREERIRVKKAKIKSHKK